MTTVMATTTMGGTAMDTQESTRTLIDARIAVV
jgi:hypothetical protein